MDVNLEKTLRDRAKNDLCIICGKDLTKQTAIIALGHSEIGSVLVCESHIKQSGNDT
jgi:hypothetical protein